MAKATKRGPDVPLPEELLDRSIGLLEGPLNTAVERVLKSKLVLVPLGFGVMLTTKTLGFVLHGAKKARPRTPPRQER
ncbi:MAG TPA: hypothetical protein VGF99_19845 [Myxococcota bacterium]